MATIYRSLALLFIALVSGCDQGFESQAKPERAVADVDGVDNEAADLAAHAVSTDVFVDVAAQSGLQFVHANGTTDDKYHLPLIMGSGVGLIDYDSDGDLDVYLVQGGPLEDSKNVHDQLGDRLFRNLLIESGALTFEDVTEQANLSVSHAGMGVATGDYDADGDVDLFITAYGADIMLQNQGDGTFEEVAGPWHEKAWSASAAFLDFDGDGDLDLYVTRYLDYNPKNSRQCFLVSGLPDYCSPDAFRGLSDKLYQNDQDSGFIDVSVEAGLTEVAAPGLGVVASDFNADGKMDIYVANDGKANQLWVNQGGGRFVDEALIRGAAVNDNGRPEAGMGLTAADFDNDGDEDLFMTHLASETNTLYRNDGKGQFLDRTTMVRASDGALAYTGFGVSWFDYNNDGRLDLFVANGGVARSSSSTPDTVNPYGQENLLYRSEWNDKKNAINYRLIKASDNNVINKKRVSRGAAFGDVDNDGDVDIVVTNNNGPVELLINQIENSNSLRLTLVGEPPNTQALGAKVGLLRGNETVNWRTVRSDGSYLSASDTSVHFGALNNQAGHPLAKTSHVVVFWPNGLAEKWPIETVGDALVQGSGKPY